MAVKGFGRGRGIWETPGSSYLPGMIPEGFLFSKSKKQQREGGF
jgi:hypothetical protein